MGNIIANNKLYIGGGWVWNNDWEETNSVEIRDLATNAITFDCLSAVNAFRKDNKIIFISGSNYFNTISNRFDILDLTTNLWSIGEFASSYFVYKILFLTTTLFVQLMETTFGNWSFRNLHNKAEALL